MNNLVVFLGSALLTVLILAIPALTTLSLVLDWNTLIQCLLIGLSVFEYFTIYVIILSESE
jgi:hypothetical protein